MNKGALLHFSHLSGICEYYASKNIPFLLLNFYRAIFSHFRMNQSDVQQVQGILTFFQARNGSSWSIVVGNV